MNTLYVSVWLCSRKSTATNIYLLSLIMHIKIYRYTPVMQEALSLLLESLVKARLN